uniref:Heparan sulphate-N-deacetylase domain-containing protein n=1 Tax=Eptatretus burgeri TaxID=7764 RepID=A0A8C4WVH1_EPTBU
MRMHCLLVHRRPLPRPSRRPDPRHLLLLLLLFSATSLGLLAYYVSRSSRRVSLFVAPTPNRGTQTTHLPFRPLQSCSEPWVKGIKHRRSTENLEPSLMKSNISGSLFAKHSWLGTQRNIPVVLLFLETHYSSLGQEIIALLEGARFGYQLEVAAAGFKGDLPSLRAPDGQARFAAVVFENVLRYVRLDGHKKKLLEKYCSQFGMGIIGFLQINEHGSPGPDLPGLGLRVQTFSELKHATINPTATALRLTRPGNTFPGLLPGREWSAFHWNASTFQSLLLAYPIACQPSQGQAETVVVYDRGLQDGVQRVIFGNGLFFWLQRLLFVDILAAVSRGRLSLKPDRYLLVDIDDIFVGKDGTRMSPADVEKFCPPKV